MYCIEALDQIKYIKPFSSSPFFGFRVLRRYNVPAVFTPFLWGSRHIISRYNVSEVWKIDNNDFAENSRAIAVFQKIQ
jgi:hypothetical protein